MKLTPKGPAQCTPPLCNAHHPSMHNVLLRLRLLEMSYLTRRSRAYVDRKYSSPPSIDTADTHPFFSDIAAKEVGGTPQECSLAQKEGPGRRASAARSPSPAATLPSLAQRSPAPKALVPAAKEQPPAQLFDLLNLDAVSHYLRLTAMARCLPTAIFLAFWLPQRVA